jgi:hypothetical protein
MIDGTQRDPRTSEWLSYALPRTMAAAFDRMSGPADEVTLYTALHQTEKLVALARRG